MQSRFVRFAQRATALQQMPRLQMNRLSKLQTSMMNPMNLARRSYQSGSAAGNGFLKTITSTPWTGMKVAGAAASIGLGCLIGYGLCQPANYVPSNTRNMIRSFSGPQFAQMVRSRMMKTYGYIVGGLGITAAAAVTMFSRGYAARFANSNPIMMTIGCVVGMMGLMIATQATPYDNVLLKHAFGTGFSVFMGFTLCPLVALGGALLQQAAMITGVIVGSLSLVAMAAPDDQFLSWGPYLGVGLGVVVAASFGSMFFPGSALLESVCLYGGLGLFGCFVCYDTQKMKYHAEMDDNYDPINRGFGMYMNTINIFIRIVSILSNRKKK